MEHFAQQLAVWGLPVLAAIILHEVSHGFVANRLGDPTARRAGRLTLNPFPHVDPIGTLLLPGFLLLMSSPFVFGYAKPVPVNFRNLRNPKRDMIWVAAAGPLTNIALAIASALVFRGLAGTQVIAGTWSAVLLMALASMLQASVVINIVLAVFNLLPILPLDGGRVLTGLLPVPQAMAFSRLEPYGFVIIVLLLASGALDRVIGPVINAFLRVLL